MINYLLSTIEFYLLSTIAFDHIYVRYLPSSHEICAGRRPLPYRCMHGKEVNNLKNPGFQITIISEQAENLRIEGSGGWGFLRIVEQEKGKEC